MLVFSRPYGTIFFYQVSIPTIEMVGLIHLSLRDIYMMKRLNLLSAISRLYRYSFNEDVPTADGTFQLENELIIFSIISPKKYSPKSFLL